jgi:hypothetical protein
MLSTACTCPVGDNPNTLVWPVSEISTLEPLLIDSAKCLYQLPVYSVSVWLSMLLYIRINCMMREEKPNGSHCVSVHTNRHEQVLSGGTHNNSHNCTGRNPAAQFR